MIARKENGESSAENNGSAPRTLPNSKKVFVSGKLHPNIRVPFREISLAPTKTMSGEIEANEPVRVYDTSGPWGDPDFRGDLTRGLSPVRANWIRERGDVEEIAGRMVRPIDDGYLSPSHAESSAKRNGSDKYELKSKKFQRRPLRASAGHRVTQLWYARQGIITPEMEFIAIRENMRRANIADHGQDTVRDDLDKQHAGSTQQPDSPYTPGIFRRFPQRIPAEITPEFV